MNVWLLLLLHFHAVYDRISVEVKFHRKNNKRQKIEKNNKYTRTKLNYFFYSTFDQNPTKSILTKNLVVLEFHNNLYKRLDYIKGYTS